MSKDNNLHDFLQDVADAIKEKKGTTEPINAQSFSEEIKNLPSGSSPFAVDFGEEIATGNPTFINALQEDIDYYNEVVNNVRDGIFSEADYVNQQVGDISEKGKEFRRKIAFWPKNFTYKMQLGRPYTNLKTFYAPNVKLSNGYYMFRGNGSMQICQLDLSELTSAQWMFENCCSLRSIDMQNAPITNASKLFNNCHNLREVKGLNLSQVIDASYLFYCCYSIQGKLVLDLTKCTNITNILESCYMLEEIDINLPVLTQAIQYSFRDLVSLKKATFNLPNISKNTYFLYSSNNVEELYLSGMRYDTDLKEKKKLTLESIKYICDNCLTRDDGASYTLTLNAAVKTAFLAKCDEDAEYAASLASANAKGLTLA